MRPLALATALVALIGCQQTLHLSGGSGGAGGGGGGAAGRPGTSAGGGPGGYGAGGFGAFGFDGGGTDQHCPGPPNYLTFTPDTPNVVVALDRSSSMSQTTFPNSADTHLNVARAGVYSDVSSYSAPHSSHPWMINFSYIDFPNQGTACSGPRECCANDVVHVTPTDFQTKTSCDASCVTTSNRPTSAALHAADQALANVTGGARFVVLISDGNPMTQSCQPDDDCFSAISAVNTLVSHHVALYVVAIGGGNSTSCLEDLAMTAAGTVRAPSYASASDSSTLQAAITEAVLSTVCGGTVGNLPNSSSTLQVSMSSGSTTNYYPYSSYEGWTYDGAGHIRLHGSLCDAYTQNPAGLVITLGCAQGPPGHPSGGGP